jgi:hypothetical protein
MWWRERRREMGVGGEGEDAGKGGTLFFEGPCGGGNMAESPDRERKR